MVTIKVSDGIGNQLFQYALGYSLKQQFNKSIRFDTSFYNIPGLNGATQRDLLLTRFCLTDFEIKPNSETQIKHSVVSKAKRFIERKLLPYYKRSYVFERKLVFDPNILKIADDVYLDGYWHSYKYFEGLETALQGQLTLKEPLTIEALNFAEIIKKSTSSVSIHIRRKDYLSKYQNVYHAQSNAYYTKAINEIYNRSDKADLTLFVFSDDILWCEQNLHLPFKFIFVKGANMHAYEDLVLMSYCDHNIIANSTYSWWGAFANKNSKKIVVAPKIWFKNQEDNQLYTQYLYPPSWICL